MEKEALRLQLIGLACAVWPHLEERVSVVETAREFEDFVFGEDQDATAD